MNVVELRNQQFESFGRCIYCGSDGGEGGLHSEHIMPYSLGGNAELLGGSCTECEKITSYLDGYLARHCFYEFRARLGMQSRGEYPEHWKATLEYIDRTEERIAPIGEHPFHIVLPCAEQPGILLGEAPTEAFRLRRMFSWSFIPPNLSQQLGLQVGEIANVRRRGTFNPYTFGRAIAKIAYCHAVVNDQLGLFGFRPLWTPDLILGRYPCVPYLFGSDMTVPDPPENKAAHQVLFSTCTSEEGGLTLLLATVRLFAHAGTDAVGMPTYQVILGAIGKRRVFPARPLLPRLRVIPLGHIADRTDADGQ